MMKYDSYKDSGIRWLGEIPEHWEKIRLKDYGYLQNGLSKGKEYFGSGFPFLSYSNVYNDSVDLDSIVTLAKSDTKDQTLYSVKENDVFFTRTSETIDEIGIAATAINSIPTATFSGFVIRFRPNRKTLFKGYSKYLYRAHIYRNYLCKEIAIVTRASLNQNVLGSLTTIIPPLTEQKAIAQYLDTKTQVIDKKVGLLQQKIDYYTELRQSIINDSATKGLNKNVELKDSGIDWIGQIPKQWEVKRIKDDFNTLAGGTPSTKNPDYWEGDIPWIPSGNVQNNMVEANSVKDYISPLALKESSTKIAQKDSILIALTGATCSNIGYLTFDTTINQSIVAILPKIKAVPKFYYYFLISARDKIRTLMSGGAQGGINQEDVRFFKIVVPARKEQTEIAQYLDNKTSTIDAIVTNIAKQIDHLKELRKTLINDVVTGKLKVVE